VAVGADPLHPGDLLRQRAPVAVSLGELHDRPVRLPGMEERLLPVRVGEVDVDGAVPGGADTLERRGKVFQLEGEVVRSVAVTGDEALEEVVPLDVPRLEQLDIHARGGVPQPQLHGPEADAVAAEQDDPAELADEDVECVAHVARRQGYVVQVHASVLATTE
jgi:hypothetical protein